MDLGTRPRTTAALLSGLRAEVEGRQASLVREWATIVEWASDHIVSGPQGAATITEGYLDTGVPIAGPGAPLVSEFALMELVAVLGRTPDGGKAYVGRVIECAWRLPNVYEAVVTGRWAPWRAERIADLTHALSAEAAGFVDRQLFNASGVGHTTVIIRPVIDLADHVPVGSYEIPERHKTRVALRDHTCRFPHCTRPAQRCDIDHHRPHSQGGPTCPGNEVPLCRRHHRAKTHSTWRYDIVTPGSYVWTSPTSYQFRVDHRGTHPIHPPDE